MIIGRGIALSVVAACWMGCFRVRLACWNTVVNLVADQGATQGNSVTTIQAVDDGELRGVLIVWLMGNVILTMSGDAGSR